MAIVGTLSNHIKYQLLKLIESHTIKAILMDTSFVFDKDSHATLGDITANQLSTGNGYTQDNKELANVAVIENDTEDTGVLTCDDPTFTASGGDIGPFGSMCFYDDTMSDDTVVGCVEFNVPGGITISDGFSYQSNDITFSLR